MTENEQYYSLERKGEEIKQILNFIANNSDILTQIVKKKDFLNYIIENEELFKLILNGEDAIKFTDGKY